MSAPGRTRWALSAGHAPSRSSGPEPAFTSRDQIAVLNAGDELANLRLHVHYESRAPVGPFRIGIAPRRLRVLRINDLVFPEAVRLDEPYALVVECDVPVVVQFTRQDTRAAANAGAMTMAWSQAD